VRYYDITVSHSKTGAVYKQWTSYPGGNPDPAALNVLFDIPTAPYATPVGMQSLTIEGISLKDLTEAQNFAGMQVTLKGGMGGGLPLENPKQAGLLAKAQIFQAFGNWVGTDMRLDFILIPSLYTHHKKGPFSLTWTPGMDLSTALKNTLSIAYPGMPISMNISSSWVASHDQSHACDTMTALALHIHNATSGNKIGPVNISIQNGKILVYDGTYVAPSVQLQFNDFIGQPTWIDVDTMQFKTVMRADLQMGSRVLMPAGYQNAPGFIVTSAQSFPSSEKYKSTFTQAFEIIKMRQLGNFRSSDSGEWATIFNAVQLK
jgi:hypothetical protein